MANPLDARFCGGCGAQLSQTCAECGSANDPGMRFCNHCGAPLDREQAAQPLAAPPADRVGVEPAVARERRFVTVLFVDLVGFTTLSESRDPEEVRDLLSQYFEMCRQVIGRYGGSVEKFIGDAVMAVWGLPSRSRMTLNVRCALHSRWFRGFRTLGSSSPRS